MRIIVDNSYREITLNIRVEEEEGRFTAPLSCRQYDRVYRLWKESNGHLLVRPYKASDFSRAEFGCGMNLEW